MSDSEILKEITETYETDVETWRHTRDEARRDLQCLVEGPWPHEERVSRNGGNNGPKRPCLTLDELWQYINQAEGNIRQAKRGIKIDPNGNGANDDTARLRQGIIRQIEYESNAAEAYINAYVSMLRQSYGAFRIRRAFPDSKSFDQVLQIAPFQNADCVIPDPNCKSSDYSDMEHCFVIDPITRAQFKRKYPDAEIKDFTSEHHDAAPQWITDNIVQVAEYWKVKKTKRTLVMFGHNYEVEYLDELKGAEIRKGNGQHGDLWLPGQQGIKIQNLRKTEDPFVTCYITNGVEILEETPWTIERTGADGKKRKGGKYIPIVYLTGKEVYYQPTESGMATRYIFSLIRMARDPYMLYCYARTSQAELLGQVPKIPAVGYVGQFEGEEDNWAEAGRVPKGFLQAHGKTEETGEQILPLPSYPQFNPPLEKMELVAQAARQAIQAAIGMTFPGVLNGKVGQDQEAKSGVALKAVQQQSAEGGYHFTDAYNNAIRHAGRVMDDLLDVTYDTARDMALMEEDDTRKVVRINDPGAADHLPIDVGDHQVTISTGPSFASQREAVENFADGLVQNQAITQAAIANPNGWPAKVLSLAVKLKNLGPLGDKMADEISPQQQQPIPPQVQQAMQKQGQLLQLAQQEIGKLTNELEFKTDLKMKELANDLARNANDNRTKLAIALVQAGQASNEAELDARLRQVENQTEMLHESELAPGPDSGSQGIHPSAPPADPNSPEVIAAQAAAQPAQGVSA